MHPMLKQSSLNSLKAAKDPLVLDCTWSKRQGLLSDCFERAKLPCCALYPLSTGWL